MLKTILIALTSIFLVSNSSDESRVQPKSENFQSGTLEKMMVASGSVTMDVDLNRLNGGKAHSQKATLHFGVAPDSFFTILVFNGELRGPEHGAMSLLPQTAAPLPALLNASLNQLVLERTDWGGPFELVVRDGRTGLSFFNVEGMTYDYNAGTQTLRIKEGRLLLAKEFAAKLGRPSQEGYAVGEISVASTMRPIEVTQVVNGETRSSVMPAIEGIQAPNLVAGPDVIVGDLSGLAQFGSSSGTQVGLAVGTDSCNAGVVPLNWLATPNNDHPVIPQNLYRMSGGATNDERFEQIGQSSVKHAFTALQDDICGFGCNATASTTLGSGCSDPYTASLNSGQSGNSLGSRAWINPFSGAYPRGDSATPPNSHAGHTHTGPSHRLLVEISDLNTALNPGATYYVEAQYVTPHEYAWCQANAGQCNMYNNASYRRYNVTGTGSPFSFTAVGATLRSKSAIGAWTGSSSVRMEPDPGNDGIAFVAYKVTNPSPGVWHYEYAVYNQNLDRAIQSFSVPLGAGVTVSNIGFHAPPQHPAWANDGTAGSGGYSATAWTPTQTVSALTWSSQTLAQNANANAIRWGTLYNFRFDSNRPPATTNATVGFFKTGAPVTAQIQAPSVPTATNGNIGGIIADGQGMPLAGATVSLNGTQTRQTISDASGRYSFDNLETNGFYTVTLTRANYTFSPASRSFSLLGVHADASFTGSLNGIAVNPLDTSAFFVRQQYLDFLGREPDESGLNFWNGQILACGSEATCIERRTINVSAAYFLSIEFQQTGGLVDGLYRASYGRAPHYAEFMPDTAVVARDVVVGRANWAQLLEANKQAFIAAWVQRADFRAQYDGLTDSAFVDTLIGHAGGSFNGGHQALVNGLSSGSLTRAAALREIVENDGFVNAKRNEAFVMMQYFGYLRREPDENGYRFWLNKLNQFGGNFEQAEMVKAFLTSSEYRGRFPR